MKNAVAEQEKRADYFGSVVVTEPDDVEVLSSEKVWEILDYVHASPEGVRPKEVAEEFDIGLNQAYDKLKQLERQGYVKRKKERGKRGREQQRKTLLYVSSPWGGHELQEDFEGVLSKKYGEFVMQKVRPVLIEFFKRVLEDMRKDDELNPWLPAGHRWCPDCGIEHQAWELFRALVAYAGLVVQNWSYEWYQTLLDNHFINRESFNENTEKPEDAYDWVFSDVK